MGNRVPIKRARSILLSAVMLCLCVGGGSACSNEHSEETKDEKFQTLQQGMAPQVPGQVDGHTAVYSVTIADQAAERIVNLDAINQAYVLLFDGNAYVAVQMHDNRVQIPGHIKAEIVEQVKAEVPEAQDVFVSASLTFVDPIFSYVRDVNDGRSDAGKMVQIKRLLQHSFTRQHSIP